MKMSQIQKMIFIFSEIKFCSRTVQIQRGDAGNKKMVMTSPLFMI